MARDATGVSWTGNPDAAAQVPTCVPPDDLSPLAHSAHAGDVNEVRRLLAAGVSPDQRSGCGPTPLMAAIAPFISEPNAPRAREAARSKRKVVIIDILMRAGADVSVADGHGLTALHRAASMSTAEATVATTVTRLLKAGAPVDARTHAGITPLFFAVETGRVKVAEVLLGAGANPHAESARGTPLALAEQSASAAMVAALRRKYGGSGR